MADPLIRLANYAHRQPAWCRKPLIAIAMTGIVVRKLLWWCLIPVFWVAYPAVMALGAFSKAVAELPLLTVNQLRDDGGYLARNWHGAARVWRTRKLP